MAHFIQRPENALKRCEELIYVGQKEAALNVLDSVIKSKRHRQWTPILEDIIKKILSLCTASRQPRRAKDGLIHYRGIAAANPSGPESILKVVTSFLAEGEKAVLEAEGKAGLGAEVVANLADLEAEQTPETMMLSVLSNDLSDTGRADRDNYVQWLRFLWESYRTCLEVLKNNSKFEDLYADTAKKTFDFCVRYKRKTEFRRLKDLLKTHLQNAPHAHLAAISGSDVSLRLKVDVRVEQLNAATQLDLWQLAFESAEELHSIISHPANRKAFKSKVMMTYYDKISQVFWVSENYLFHACAMQKIYNITDKQRGREVSKGELTREQANKALQVLASQLVLGALAVPHHAHRSGYDTESADPEREKHQRMAVLVGHNNHVPHRKNVISDVVQKNVLSLIFPELSGLYALLEEEFDPLSLGERVKPIIAFIEGNPDLAKYAAPLKKTVLLKLVQQLGCVYQTLKIADFARLADFMSLHDCEKFIVEVVARGQVAVRLDHKNGTLNYGDHAFESDRMRGQLTSFGKGLQGVLAMVQTDLRQEARRQKAEAFKQLSESLDDERKMMIRRRQQIEERKEEVEREMALKLIEDDKRKKEEEEVRRLTEEQRKEEEQRKREEDKKRKEKEEKELAEKKRIKEQLDALKVQDKKNKAATAPAELKVGEEDDEEELKKIDKTALMQAKKEQEEKLKREAEERVALSVQKLDHLERARRESERDLLQQLFVTQKEEDKIRWERESKQFMENHKKKFEEDKKKKGAFLRMVSDKTAYEAVLQKRREEDFEREKAAYKEHVRKERARAKKEKEDRERREREEAEKRQAEEEEKRRIFEEERRKREEQRAALDAATEKQRAREAEIEAKQAAASGGGGGGDRGGERWGGGGDRGPPRREGFGDRFGDRDGPRRDGGGFGDRDDRGPPRREGGGFGDRDDRGPPRREGGGFGDRDDRGPPRRYEPPSSRGGFGDRDDRGPPRREGGGFGDRDDRGPPRRDFGGGGFGDRDDRGPPRREGGGFGDRDDRGPPRREGGGFGDRDDRGPPRRYEPPSSRGGFGDRDDRGGGDRYGDRGDRGGYGGDRGGSRYGGGDSGQWGSLRSEDRAVPSGDRDRGGGGDGPSERPRLNLKPRTVGRDEGGAAGGGGEGGGPPRRQEGGDDGFTTVSKKR